MKLAQRVQRIKPSPTIAAAAKARALKAQGVDICDLTVGEPDLDTPDFIKEAAMQALREGYTKYTDARGMEPLRKAICEKLERDNGLHYTPDQIVASCGAKHALFNAFQALIDPGEQVLIPAPYWVSYPDMVLVCDGEPVIIPTTEETGFKPTPKQIADAITDRTRVLLINSPCNPTGAVWERELLEEIAEIVLKHENLFVISDEVYECLVYDGRKHVSIASLNERIKERTIVVNALSKTFAMTGWRLGYAAAPKPIADAMAKIQSQSTTNPTTFVQVAAIKALREPGDFPQKMLELYDFRRHMIVTALNNIDGVRCRMPEGAFYAFAKFQEAIERKGFKDDYELCDFLLEKAHVATVAGSAFGAPGYLRLSFATSEDTLQEAARRIKEALWGDQH
jgi:aspartate aminotransferase